MKDLVNLRNVLLNQYKYTLSVENKKDFVVLFTKQIMQIPLVRADEMLEEFTELITSKADYYDIWLNFCLQIFTESEDGAASLSIFLTEFKGLVDKFPGSDAFDISNFAENPQGIILLALRVYLEVLDKPELDSLGAV